MARGRRSCPCQPARVAAVSRESLVGRGASMVTGVGTFCRYYFASARAALPSIWLLGQPGGEPWTDRRVWHIRSVGTAMDCGRGSRIFFLGFVRAGPVLSCLARVFGWAANRVAGGPPRRRCPLPAFAPRARVPIGLRAPARSAGFPPSIDCEQTRANARNRTAVATGHGPRPLLMSLSFRSRRRC